MSGGLSAITEGLADLRAMRDRFAESNPALAEMIDKSLAETAVLVAETFRPFMEFAEGKISREQYLAIRAERAQVEQARRREHYGAEDFLELRCEECDARHEWDVEEHGGDYPPTYFTCEDVTGDDCQAEEEDDGPSYDDEAAAERAQEEAIAERERLLDATEEQVVWGPDHE